MNLCGASHSLLYFLLNSSPPEVLTGFLTVEFQSPQRRPPGGPTRVCSAALPPDEGVHFLLDSLARNGLWERKRSTHRRRGSRDQPLWNTRVRFRFLSSSFDEPHIHTLTHTRWTDTTLGRVWTLLAPPSSADD